MITLYCNFPSSVMLDPRTFIFNILAKRLRVKNQVIKDIFRLKDSIPNLLKFRCINQQYVIFEIALQKSLCCDNYLVKHVNLFKCTNLLLKRELNQLL